MWSEDSVPIYLNHHSHSTLVIPTLKDKIQYCFIPVKVRKLQEVNFWSMKSGRNIGGGYRLYMLQQLHHSL